MLLQRHFLNVSPDVWLIEETHQVGIFEGIIGGHADFVDAEGIVKFLLSLPIEVC